MDQLNWIIGLRVESLIRREYDWVLVFTTGENVVVGCLWRLVKQGRIVLTSEDDGHKFGLPAPVDAMVDANARISGQLANHVELREGTLDLGIRFDGGSTLQIIPNSSGYEAWSACRNRQQFIAIGGGDLSVFG